VLLLQRFYRDAVPGSGHLAVEGFLVALLGAGFAHWLFPDEATLVLVFLTAVAMDDSMDRLLGWNRRLIFEEGCPPRLANLRLTRRTLALFGGAALGFSILALSLPLEIVEELFKHQIADYQAQSFSAMDFGHPVSLLVLNLYVFLFFFVIAIPFHHGGLMIAVTWNASVWGATFAVLARRWSEGGGPALAEAYVRVITACLPHMALEAYAYVLAGSAGVFLGRAMMLHSLLSDVLSSVAATVVRMMAVGLAVVAVAALWEGLLAPLLVTLLQP